MIRIERIDESDLRDLCERTDEFGVLSVYVNADPRGDPDLQGTEIDLRNRFRELQRRIGEDAGSDDPRDVSAALERLWPHVEELALPETPGLAQVAFAGLASEWYVRLESTIPVTTRVVLDDGPFIHPLLELLDEGRAAGVVLVSAEGARLLEWRLGSLRLLSRMDREYVEAPHERAGQVGGGPEGLFHTPMHEQRQAREYDRTQRFLDRVSTLAADLAVDRAWERMLVSGGERWTEPTIEKLPQAVREKASGDTRVLNALDDDALATVVTKWVHDRHTERQRQLLERTYEAGRTRTGVLGLSEVAAALNAGRVAHLVYDPEVRYTGTVGANGTLYGGDEAGPDGQSVISEPRLTERLVEQALRTGARVSPIKGGANGVLREAEGIAALVRW